MRGGDAIRYAVLGVIAHHPRGVHGYALKRQCDRILGHFWQVNLGEVYRVLDHLAAEGCIEAALGSSPSRRRSTKKSWRITDTGRQSLDRFVLEPPNDLPRPLRYELAVKLLFAGGHRLPEVLRLIDCLRDTYMHEVHLLDVQRRKLRRLPVDGFIVGLLIDGAELGVRAEFAWLDQVSEKLRERLSAAPP